MPEETALFLDSLFAQCRLPASISFSALDPRGSRPTPSRHVPLGNPAIQADTLLRLQAANRLGWGACVGIATRRAGLGRWSRGSRRDLAELPALFVDIDGPGNTQRQLSQLADFALPPSCIVLSSGPQGGLHAYWNLTTPTRHFEHADRALRGLAARFNADPVLTITHSMCTDWIMSANPV